MFGITLYTRSGEPVTSVIVPPWKVPPEAYLWGERTFFRHTDGKYYEGLMAYVVPTANHCLGNSEPTGSRAPGEPSDCGGEECVCLCGGCVTARQFGQETYLPLKGDRCDICGNTEVAERTKLGESERLRCENHKLPT